MTPTSAPGQATDIARDAYEPWNSKLHRGRWRRDFVRNSERPISPESRGPSSPPWDFFRWVPAILFFATSATAASNMRSSHFWRNVAALATSMRLQHRDGDIYFINLLSMGFSADVATLRTRRFSTWGELGYLTSIFLTLARFNSPSLPDAHRDATPHSMTAAASFVTFNNSKFTGGTMMIAPQAEINDGMIEYVRWGPIGRLGLIRNLPSLYDGTHINHPLAERKSISHVEFNLDHPVDVMVDGEVLTLHCEEISVLPAALNVVA